MAQYFNRALFLLSFVVLCTSVFCRAQAQQRVELSVGEQREFTLHQFAEVKLSRRGLLDVRVVNQEKLLLTGLRKGFLIVYLLAPESDTPVEALHVTVGPSPEESVPPAAKRLAQLSREAGLRCRDHCSIIGGETGDYEGYFQIKNLCEKYSECTFFAQLNQAGQEKWRSFLSHRLGTHYEISISAGGAATLLTTCTGSQEQALSEVKSLIDGITNGLVTNKSLVVLCRHTAQLESYYLAAKVVLVSDTTLKEWGAEAYALLNGILSVETFRRPAEAYIKSLAHENEIKIVGEPIVKTSSGRLTVVSSGGEFLAAREFSGKIVKEAGTLWKSYGLQLEVTPYPLADNKALLNYKLSFKQPSSSKDYHLRGSSLDSSVVLSFAQAEIVGSITLQSLEKKEKSLPILHEIPLIGPIFRMVSNEDAQSQLFLWLRLSRDQGDGLPPGIVHPAAAVKSP
jgi:hypothetical protein